MATVDEVTAESQDNKLKALQAMAAGSTDPYNSGQQQIRDSQSQALSQLATSAAQGKAPAAGDELAPTVSGPGDAAIAALAQGSGPYANDLSAIRATGVASGGSSLGSSGGGSQFPVQMYGPYARYGGYGSQGELEDAVLGRARMLAASAHNNEVALRVKNANLYRTGASHEVVGSPSQLLPGSVSDVPAEQMPGLIPGVSQAPPVSPDQQALLRAASAAFHGQKAPVPEHGLFGGLAPPAPAPGPGEIETVVRNGHTYEIDHRPSHLNERELFGPAGVQLGAADPAAPLNLYQFARQAAIEHGAAPMYAQGLFSPEWASGIYKGTLQNQNAIGAGEFQALERRSNGMVTPEEQAQLGSAQAAIAAQQIKSSPEYQSGAKSINDIVAAVEAGKQKLPSLDELRIMLFQSPAKLPAEVIGQLLKDYSGLVVAPGTAQATNPDQYADPYGNNPYGGAPGNGVGG